LQQKGFEVVLGDCMDGARYVSAPAKERATELTAMLTDTRIRAVIPPWGGELAADLLPHLDWARIGPAGPTSEPPGARRALLAAVGRPTGGWMWSILRHAVPVILEHALLPVLPREAADFESAFAEAKAIIAAMPGFLRLTLSRCLERPDTYLLLVEWERLVDHTEGFRGSPQYQEWRRLLHSFYEPFPVVEHYEQVYSA
jgi:heme-degrading monooxygenase HmoA